MAAGQLSGGLSWLAISGEDAHDLVVTAPVSPDAVLHAKIEAVGVVIVLVVLTPIVILMLFASLELALITAGLRGAVVRLGHRHPALVPRADAPRHVPPPPGRLARLDHRRSAELDLLGRHRGARRRRPVLIALLPAVLALITLAVAFGLAPRGRRT